MDAGPLAAIVDIADQHHKQCVAALQRVREPLCTLWPLLTEAFHLLSDVPNGHEALWQMIGRGAVSLLPLDSDDMPRIRELMQKYQERPMDLADAALIRVAEREGVRKIFTVDRKDFSVYRLHGRVKLSLLP
jgi:predicted nucleic acid-binding protein